jgi:hypothetical protein
MIESESPAVGSSSGESPASTAVAPNAPRKELPPAKVAAPIGWLASLLRSSERRPDQQTRQLAGDKMAAAVPPPLLPADPEAVLGASKALGTALVNLAGKNKGLAIVAAVILVAGLGLFGVMKLSQALGTAERQGESARRRPEMVERYAHALEALSAARPEVGGRPHDEPIAQTDRVAAARP